MRHEDNFWNLGLGSRVRAFPMHHLGYIRGYTADRRVLIEWDDLKGLYRHSWKNLRPTTEREERLNREYLARFCTTKPSLIGRMQAWLGMPYTTA